MRKILLITALLLIVAAGLYLGRSYIFKFAELEPIDTGTPIDVQGGDDVDDDTLELLRPLTTVPVFDFWVDQSDRMIYFITDDGSLYRMVAGGAPETIFSSGIASVSSVRPAPRGPSALVESGYPGNQFFSIINPVARTRQFLPLGAVAAGWNPDGSEVVFLKTPTPSEAEGGAKPTLNIFNIATARSRLITSINMIDVTLDWKTQNEIYINPRATAGVSAAIWGYDMNKRTMRQISPETAGHYVRWFSASQGLRLSNTTTTIGSKLELLNGQTGALLDLPVSTLPDKCFIEQISMYCGEPLTLEGLRLPDEYFQRKAYTTDNAVRIDLATAKRTVIFNARGVGIAIDIYHPIKVGSELYFINRYDNRLYGLAL